MRLPVVSLVATAALLAPASAAAASDGGAVAPSGTGGAQYQAP